jgi:hypothetical protein
MLLDFLSRYMGRLGEPITVHYPLPPLRVAHSVKIARI